MVIGDVEYMTTDEIAEKFEKDLSTVRLWISQGRFGDPEQSDEPGNPVKRLPGGRRAYVVAVNAVETFTPPEMGNPEWRRKRGTGTWKYTQRVRERRDAQRGHSITTALA
jgi:hypothetical protein